MSTEQKFKSAFDFHSIFEYNLKATDMNKTNTRLYKPVFSYHSVAMTSDEERDNVQKESQLVVFLRSVITAVLYFFIISLFPLSFWICVKRVHPLERLVLIRLGHLQPIRGPGFTVVLPCVDVWTKIDLRPKMFTVSTLQLLTSDGGIIEAKADVEYHVANAVSYFTKLQEGENTLKNIAQYCLKNMISEKDQEDVLSKRDFISSDLKDELNNSAANWGLEVLKVSIHSIKVIKQGEPIDAIGTLMTALKAATGQSSKHTAAFFPFMHLMQANNVGTENVKRETCTTAISENKSKNEEQFMNKGETDDCLIAMKQLAEHAEEKKVQDLTAKLKFNLTGSENRVIYCFAEKGKISVFESSEQLDFDVKLMLSESTLKDILNSKISPMDAYMDGQIKVSGDWTLLSSIPKLFQN